MGTPRHAQEPPGRGMPIERRTTGFASPAEDHLEAPLSLDELVSRHPSATYFLRMTGDAMLPTLHRGDVLVIDRALDPSPGTVVAATVGGRFVIRRYQPGMHGVYLVADNPKSGAIRLTEDAENSLWGVVTYLVRSVRDAQNLASAT